MSPRSVIESHCHTKPRAALHLTGARSGSADQLADVLLLILTIAPVAVNIGGIPATVLFAGLTPGYVGLCQVNVIVPSGVTPGTQVPVPVTVSVAGKSDAGKITIATR